VDGPTLNAFVGGPTLNAFVGGPTLNAFVGGPTLNVFVVKGSALHLIAARLKCRAIKQAS